MMNQAFNPNMMTGMLKNNVTMVLSSMIQLGWVNLFYQGFVVAKVPFPLTQHFRSILNINKFNPLSEMIFLIVKFESI